MSTDQRPTRVPPDPAMTLGALLRTARRRQGDSQRRLADRLCAAARMPTVSRHEVSRWERGARLPSAYWLGWLAQVLVVDRAVLERAAARGRRTAVTRPGAGADPRRAWAWRVVEIHRVTGPAGAVVLCPGPPGTVVGRPDTVAA